LTVEEDPFVPTPQDLAGFWDMVYIQVEHIHALFAELAQLRKDGWKRATGVRSNTKVWSHSLTFVYLQGQLNGSTLSSSSSIMSTPSPNAPKTSNSNGKVRKSSAPSAKSKSSSSISSPSPKASEAAKARDAARKKMLEEKKRLMREKKAKATETAEGDSLFVQF